MSTTTDNTETAARSGGHPDKRGLAEDQAARSDGAWLPEMPEDGNVAAAQGGAEESISPGPSLLRRVLPGLALAGSIGAIEFARQRFQASHMFVPDVFPNGIWDPAPYGVNATDVWFESEDGVQLHGWWIPMKRARGTVLYCHGNAGNITNRIGVYRYLHRMKLNVFAFDYRGYGRSEGVPSEKGVCADARAAWDHLSQELEESPERIVLFGHSLGGAIAIDCATKRACAGLVAQSTFTNIKEMAKVRYPGVPLHLIATNRFRSLDKVRHLEIPKLFIHGTADETIPHVIGERLFENAAEPKEWYSVPHAGHNDVYRFGGFRYLWRVSRFMKACLK